MPSAKKINPRRSPKKRKREEELESETTVGGESEVVVRNDTFKVKEECTKCSQMAKKCRALQKTVFRYKKQNCVLKGRLSSLNHTKMRSKTSEKNIMSDCEANFCGDVADNFKKLQAKLKDRKAQGRRYSDKDKSFALALHFCSPKSYRFLQTYFCLPTTRSLRSWQQNSQVKPGMNDMVLDLLQIKCENMKPKKKSYLW